jgi:hypothetical protein
MLLLILVYILLAALFYGLYRLYMKYMHKGKAQKAPHRNHSAESLAKGEETNYAENKEEIEAIKTEEKRRRDEELVNTHLGEFEDVYLEGEEEENEENEENNDLNQVDENIEENLDEQDNTDNNENNNDNEISENVEETPEEEIDMNLDELINQFVNYISSKKVVKLNELSSRFNTDKDEVVDKLRELENHGQSLGFVDKNGNYINLNERELEVL